MIIVISDYKVLILISILTSLTVQGIKKILVEKHKSFSANLLTIIVSILMTIIVCISDAIMNDVTFSIKFVWYLIDMIVLSAIIAMVGYDKFRQTVTQIQNIYKGGLTDDNS